MEPQQNLTNAPQEIAVISAAVKSATVVEKPITNAQDLYISFCATGGLVTDEGGSLGSIDEEGYIIEGSKPMKLREFAAMVGVSRATLWNWQKTVPDFWTKVTERRNQIGGRNRIQRVWNGLYLKASAGNPQAAALFLANFDPNFRMPTEKIEHDVGGGLADLLQAARKRKQVGIAPIEAEIINQTQGAPDGQPT